MKSYNCEWNPVTDEPSWNTDDNLHPAMFEVGSDKCFWRVCGECINHDKFKGKKRRLLGMNYGVYKDVDDEDALERWA